MRQASNQRLRVAMVGCGFFAQNHLMAWRHLDCVDLVGVCDKDAARAQAFADRVASSGGHEPAVFSDLHVMLTELEPDLVDVVTTMDSHEALVAICADHGVATVCQKPFAPDLAAVRRIIANAKRAGIALMVHENFRFQGPMIQLKQLLDSGAIGEVVAGRLSWRCGFDVFKGQPYLATIDRLILLDLVIHLFDLARFLFGDAARVLARTQKVRPGIQGEDGAVCLVEHANGIVTEVLGSYHTRILPDPFPETLIRIDGTAGRLEIGKNFDLVLHRSRSSERRSIAPVPPAWGDPVWAMVQESVVNAQTHFADCVRHGREAATSASDNVKTFAMVEAAYQSADLRQWVDLAMV